MDTAFQNLTVDGRLTGEFAGVAGSWASRNFKNCAHNTPPSEGNNNFAVMTCLRVSCEQRRSSRGLFGGYEDFAAHACFSTTSTRMTLNDSASRESPLANKAATRSLYCSLRLFE